jgi:hypothetical protein
MRNWCKSFGGKSQLTSLIKPTQKERIEMVSKRRIKPPKKRGKNELTKNTKNTTNITQIVNPGGQEVVRATIPT